MRSGKSTPRASSAVSLAAVSLAAVSLAAVSLAAVSLAALSLVVLPATAAAARTAGPVPGSDFSRACSAAPAPGWARCLALVPAAGPAARSMARSPAGYGPAQLQSAYNLALASAAAGRGETVAVVDAFDDPDAAADLAVYRARYHLPACGPGCFDKVNQEGRAGPLPKRAGENGWAAEESLDVDMVSAICPNCHILLVEADNGSIGNLGKAVDAAVSLGARFVSNSYTASGVDEARDDAAYYDHPGVAVIAAAGDSGYGVGYPAESRYVTSVGGTTLVRRKGTARGWSETVWDTAAGATGSGCSAHEPKPTWQADTGCAQRTDNDVAAVANPSTGAAIYDSYDRNGWLDVGGTSVASPIIAATYALAGRPGRGSYPAQYPYEHVADLHDVTSGRDGSCGGAYLCTAKVGYDGPSGWGTPDGTGAFRAVDNSVRVASPGNRLSRKGVRITPLSIAARDSAPREPLRYTASGLPRGLSISPRGIISGTPRSRGYYLVRLHATDTTGMTGSASLRWTVESVGVVSAAGKCLDDRHGGIAQRNKVDTRRCRGGKEQTWVVYPTSGRTLQIRLAEAASMCLGVPGSPGRPAELRRCGQPGWRSGRYGHLVSPLSKLCLAEPGARPGGARLAVARCSHVPSQRWKLP